MKLRPGVFLDSSCWVAATLSRTGGSRYILALAVREHFKVLSTQRVLQEALKAIGTKYGRVELQTYLTLLANVSPASVGAASAEEESRWADMTHEDDCHVLAGALKANADFLVSLDARHIVTDRAKAHFPVRIMNTREFLEWYVGEVERQGGSP